MTRFCMIDLVTQSVFQQALPLLCDLLMHTEAADIILGGTDVLALMVKNYTPQIVQVLS